MAVTHCHYSTTDDLIHRTFLVSQVKGDSRLCWCVPCSLCHDQPIVTCIFLDCSFYAKRQNDYFFLRSQLLCQDTAERRTVYSIFAFRFRLTPQIITWRCHIVFQWTAIPHIGYSVQIHPENNYLPIKHRISREADSRDCILFKCQARASSADVTMIYILGCSHLEGNASTAFSYVGITGSEKKEEENLLGLCF